MLAAERGDHAGVENFWLNAPATARPWRGWSAAKRFP
jgi:hypothetical protein